MNRTIRLLGIMNFGISIFHYGFVIFIISCILALIVNVLLIEYIDKLMIKIFTKKTNTNVRDIQSIKTTIDFVSKIIKAIIKAVLLLFVLMQIRVLSNLGSAALGATGVMALVFGFAAQESTSTLIGGLFISVYKPFIKGDLISLPEKNLAGRVVEVGLRHTIILTVNNTRIIVPNNIMNAAIIENREDDLFYTNIFVYGIGYNSDYKLAMKLINDMLDSNELALKEGRDVVISELNSSSIDIKVIVRTKDLLTGLQLHNQLNQTVLDVFKENNIEIPFNTQTIHINKE